MLKLTILSNLFFLVPLTVAFANQIYWYAFLMGMVLIVSTCFHLSRERYFAFKDVTFAYLLMASNFYLLFMGRWNFPYAFLAIICAVVSVVFYIRQHKYGYTINHSMWHIFSAATSLCSLMTFLDYLQQ
jgi:hypothetical protein